MRYPIVSVSLQQQDEVSHCLSQCLYNNKMGYSTVSVSFYNNKMRYPTV